MPKFGKTSLQRLEQADPDLQRVFQRVVEKWNCTVLCSHRSVQMQQRLFREGKSKVEFGKHNVLPSDAVDVAPWYPEAPHIRWTDFSTLYAFGGFVLGVAYSMGVQLRWGGDWDGDGDTKDQTFNDLVHFELVRSKPSK